MKKLFFLLLFVSTQLSFGQNRFKPPTGDVTVNDQVIFNQERRMTSNMSIIDQSNELNLDKSFFYLLEVKNTSNTVKIYNITSENLACKKHKQHTDVNISFYNTSKTIQIKELVVQPGTTKTFYAKTTAPRNTKLSTWNCSNIIINNPITNQKEVTKIVFQMLDPKNVH